MKVQKAGDLLSSLLSETFDPQTLENAQITAGLYSAWAMIVKEARIPAASDHCRIRDLEHGVLVIEADHPGWVQILQTKQKHLLVLVQQKFPELKIQGISFRLSRELIFQTDKSINTVQEADSWQVAGQAAGQEAEEETVRNEALHKTMNEFKKVIQKRNKKLPDMQ